MASDEINMNMNSQPAATTEPSFESQPPRTLSEDEKYYNHLCDLSDDFANKFIEFKTESNRMKVIGQDNLAKKLEIVKHAKHTRVIIHAKLRGLIEGFILHKRQYGTTKEKDLFHDKYTFEDFVCRCLLKRPLVFFGGNDVTILRDGSMPNPKDWTTVGTENEASITLEDYMTYDEIAISALIGVSVPTFFINPGGRYNGGNPDDPKQDYGIYIALTGARFEKR